MHPPIRPFTADDYPAISGGLSAVYPDYPGWGDRLRYWDEHRDPKCKLQRWVAERNGRVVAFGGYSQLPWYYHPRKFLLDVVVQPDHQLQGIGSALYNHVMDAIHPLDLLKVSAAEVLEDMTHSIQFLKNRGFAEESRGWESRLDLAAFDPAPYAGLEEKRQAQRIQIKSLKELEAAPDRNRKLHELSCEVERDVPSTEEYTPISYEHTVEYLRNNPDLLPEAYFLAVDQGEYTGLSNLLAGGGDHLYTGFTGVRRPYRRKGIATAQKVRGIAYAKEHGFAIIRTGNDSTNSGMLAVNERLGFVRQLAWISFVKAFS